MAQQIFKSTGFKVVIVIALIVVVIGFVTNWTFKFKKYAIGGRVAEGPNPVTHPVPNPTPVSAPITVYNAPVSSGFCNEILKKMNSTDNLKIKYVLNNLYNYINCSNSNQNVVDFCQALAGAREQLCSAGPESRDMCQWLNRLYNTRCGTGSRASHPDSIECARRCNPLQGDNTAYVNCMAACSNS